MLSITTGVPQGFIIGLLLYINDFAQANKMLSFLIMLTIQPYQVH